MVRLEKIVYEKAVNTAALGRQRQITNPTKWHPVNPNEHSKRMAQVFYQESFLGRLVRPFYQAWFNFERNHHRDLLLQRGLTFEDKFLHQEYELRREELFEHVARESLHPYQWLLKCRRRERYYRIERGLRGFYVPEFIRQEVNTQTYRDYTRLFDQWAEFMHSNYGADMTPSAHRTGINTYVVLELIMNYGIWRPEAWSRYFYNEKDDSWFTEKELKQVRDPKKYPYDLTTAEGRRTFEEQIKNINSKYPGIVAPEGQSFDFKAYYAEIGV